MSRRPQRCAGRHLHGIKVLPDSDGYPEAWFTKGFAQTGPFFESELYNYPNDQPATTLWYHDHALGITRLNVYTGLAGLYIIRDEVEGDLNLPSGPYEIPLMIQDRSFNANGSLFYPVQEPDDREVPPVWIPSSLGTPCWSTARLAIPRSSPESTGSGS